MDSCPELIGRMCQVVGLVVPCCGLEPPSLWPLSGVTSRPCNPWTSRCPQPQPNGPKDSGVLSTPKTLATDRAEVGMSICQVNMRKTTNSTCGNLSQFVSLRSLTVVHPKADGDGSKPLCLRIRKRLEQLATWRNLTGGWLTIRRA